MKCSQKEPEAGDGDPRKRLCFGKMPAVGRGCGTPYLRAPADSSGTLVFQKTPARQSHVSTVSTSRTLCRNLSNLVVPPAGRGRRPGQKRRLRPEPLPRLKNASINPFKSEMQSGSSPTTSNLRGSKPINCVFNFPKKFPVSSLY